VSPIGARQRRSGARSALAATAAGPGCLVFLWEYSAIHLAHVRGFDLSVARAVSPIHLFAAFLVSLAGALIASIAVTIVARATGRPMRPHPRALVCSISLFGAVMLLFP
jgi:hypothetical protein